MRIGVGIDTGGTYTDAAAYDFDEGRVLCSAKSLTTKNDLTQGILGAIDGLDAEILKKASLISLSTTLATNACVEDRGGNAKLIFFGGEPKVIDESGGKYGLPPSNQIYIQESFTKFSGGTEREPDWELFCASLEKELEGMDGVGVVEMNATRNGAANEKKAKKIISEKFDIPVVCGHELFSALNSLQRGAGTLLNARLFPVIREFLFSVKKALAARSVDASIVIVRSDGSLMSEGFAFKRPVETLLCGPAASVLGGVKLTKNSDCVVIDMGGTTTDIALVRGGAPVTAQGGVSIGKWKTFVDGLYIKTVGLGGDSAVHYGGSGVYLEDYRVVPLCNAASGFPRVRDNLKKMAALKRNHTHFLYEHYMLIKEPGASDYTNEEHRLLAALKSDGPLTLEEAASAAGKDIYAFNAQRLVKDGTINKCGLTPTDVMHIKNDFNAYDGEASLYAARVAAHNLEISVEEYCERVYVEVRRRMFVNIVKALLENKFPDYMKNGIDREAERFILAAFESAASGNRCPLLSLRINTGFKLIGIGAPIRVFIGEIAEMLGAEFEVPENFEVANALGAIMGSVCAEVSVEIKPIDTVAGVAGYTVYGRNENKIFKKLSDAAEFAERDARDGAEAEAAARGAKGILMVNVSRNDSNAAAKDVSIYLGTTVTARAVGSAGF